MNKSNPLESEWKLERIPICDLAYSSNIPDKLLTLPVEHPIVDGDKIHIPPVVVLRQDGVYYLVNGQHTIDIVVSIKGSRETAIWCKVYENIEFQCEGDIFHDATDMVPEQEDKQ